MRSPATTLRHLTGGRTIGGLLTAAGVALALVAALPSAAHAGTLPTVLGTVDCDPTTGEQLITWRWTNPASGSEVLNFDSGVASDGALTAGSLVSSVVGMQPDAGLQPNSEAMGETIASADAVGSVGVTLVWFRTVSLSTLQVVGSVLLFGDCALPETTVVVPDTTAPVTDPTVAPTVIATAPQSTSAVGSGGGTIPRTGGTDDTLLFIAGGLVMIGGCLLVVRRRADLAD